jgi:hypothetical protein
LVILVIGTVFEHLFVRGKSGRFAGLSGRGFRETEAELGLELGFWSMEEMGCDERGEGILLSDIQTIEEYS